jgi:hypothetical protein
MNSGWQSLVKTTIFDPKEAAGQIIALRRRLSDQMLWSAVVLVAILFALAVWLNWQVAPPAPPTDPDLLAMQQRLQRFVERPALVAILAAGGIVVGINILHWSGRALGGKGKLHDMLAVLAWLQLLQIAALVIVLALATVALPLAALLDFAVSVWSLWILIAFIDRVQGFDNPLKSLATLALGLGGTVAALVLIGSLLGAFAAGGTPHV